MIEFNNVIKILITKFLTNSTVQFYIAIIVTFLAIYLAHIIAEKYTSTKKYMEWLHGINKHYIHLYSHLWELQRQDYIDEEERIWSFYNICKFIKNYKQLLELVGGLYFVYPRKFVRFTHLRGLLKVYIDILLKFIYNMEYIQDKLKFSDYLDFKEKITKDELLKEDFEKFKRWIKNPYNLSWLATVSKVFADVLLIAVMQSYPFGGFGEWIKSVILRNDFRVKRQTELNVKETIKKAEKIIQIFELKKKVLENVKLLWRYNMKNWGDNTKRTIKIFSQQPIVVFEKGELKKLGCGGFSRLLKREINDYYIDPTYVNDQTKTYLYDVRVDDVVKALINSVKLYQKLNEFVARKDIFDLCNFVYYRDKYDYDFIYTSKKPKYEETDAWIELVKEKGVTKAIVLSSDDKFKKICEDAFGRDNVLYMPIENLESAESNVERTIDKDNSEDKDNIIKKEIIKIIENIFFFIEYAKKKGERLIIVSSDDIDGLILWIWLVYEGYDVEEALDYVLEWNKNPFCLLRQWDDMKTLKTLLKDIKLKGLSDKYIL